VAADVHGKGRPIALWIFRAVLGLIFLVIRAAKLTGTLETVRYFAAIGWGQWFRYLTGLLDLVGVSLIFVPRWTSYGAVVITCTVGTATLIALFRPGLPLVVPLTFTLLAATLARVARLRRAS
jgi:uncharacterized membrane protein YphA (DoxX/SURF4 family)